MSSKFVMHVKQAPLFRCEQSRWNDDDIHECDSFHATRRKRGRGFEYRYVDGEKIVEQTVLKRFKSLVIPPMWRDVRISLCAFSKVQAFGYDQRKRKQYIYHHIWEQQRQAEKFDRLAEFARRLPSIRKVYVNDLRRPHWDAQKSCALALLLLDRTGIRIGNREYVEENGTFGLTTLRRKHIEESDDGLILSFTGKHGKDREIDIDDPDVGKLVSESASQPGYPLFRYRQDGKWEDLLSDDVNDRLRELVDISVSAKDFRTWTATRQALQFAPLAAEEISQHPRRKFVTALVKKVAQALGNTPAVCQKYYIHPAVLSYIEHRHQQGKTFTDYDEEDWMEPRLSACEKAVLNVMARYE